MQLPYANAATHPIPQGGGHHGKIGIIVKPTLYTNFSITAWNNPPDPGVYPTVPTNSTTSYQDQLKIKHKEVQRIYDNEGKMDKALNNQVINSIEDTYFKELNNKYTRLLGVRCCNIPKNILDHYRNITTADPEANNQKMNKLTDASLSVDMYFECVNNYTHYTDDGNKTCTAAQVTQKAHYMVLESGIYVNVCK